MSKNPDLLAEANNPHTPPTRLGWLANLSQHEDREVAGAAMRNTSLPVETWRVLLVRGFPETWDNPYASLELMSWQTQPSPMEGAPRAAYSLTQNPNLCSAEGRFWLNMVLKRWWQEEHDAKIMLRYLGNQALFFAQGSEAHRKLVIAIVSCAKTLTHLIPVISDRTEIESILEATDDWAKMGPVKPKQTHHDIFGRLFVSKDKVVSSASSAFSMVTKTTLVNKYIGGAAESFANHAINALSYANGYSPKSPEWKAFQEEQSAILANMIRREIPEPWQI